MAAPSPSISPGARSDLPPQPISDRPALEALPADELPANRADILAVLRRKLEQDSRSADTVIRAASEAARALTGADGVAIALRARGVIVCRARSGSLAPELGSALNLQSGISGECLRSASILVCNDTANDPRVDAEVCRSMGLRSILAVPLRGAIGIAGILEAFSSRVAAFGEEQINCLRDLAEIAEAAYEQERRAVEEETLSSLRSSRKVPTLFTRAASASSESAAPSAMADTPVEEDFDSFSTRRYWIYGMLVLAALLVLGVWLSWREPIPETTETGSAHAASVAGNRVLGESPTLVKLKPTTGRPEKERRGVGNVLKKAAAIELADAASSSGGVAKSSPAVEEGEVIEVPAGSPSGVNRHVPEEAALDEAPPVVLTTENDRQIAALAASSTPLPSADVEVSKGVTEGALIRKVDPVYPMQARAERISGPVVLEITIGTDGSVREMKTISGEPLLVAAAREAVGRWRYRPVLLNGKAIEAGKRITVVFKLP
jgi:TonB family protein